MLLMLRARLAVLRLRMRLLLLARIERLRLARRVGFAADRRLLAFAVIIVCVGKITARFAALLVIGLTLAELFLCSGNQSEVMLGVLVVVLGSDGISRTLCIAGKLKILLGDMGSRSPDFHVRSIGLVHARQWILVMSTFAVATPHALVLAVSHGLLFRQPLICGGTNAAGSLSEIDSP